MEVNPVEYNVMYVVWASSSYKLSPSSRWPHVLWSVHDRLRFGGIFGSTFIWILHSALKVGLANFCDEGLEVDVVVLGNGVVVVDRWNPNEWKESRRCVVKVFVGREV